MFPHKKWSSGILLGVVLLATFASTWANDTDTPCQNSEGVQMCKLCQAQGFGISAQACCQSSEQFDKCACALDPKSPKCNTPSSDKPTRVKREPFWKRSNDLDRRLAFWKRSEDDFEDDVSTDKRAKYFLGKRAKYFLGKRSDLDEAEAYGDYYPDEFDEEKRAKYFLGKRAKYFLGKRAKYFLGKREYDDEDLIPAQRRAKYFLGKRAKYFLGKRDDDSDDDYSPKRAKYFLGKRYSEDGFQDNNDGYDKRQKYFLGKRSTDNAMEHQ